MWRLFLTAVTRVERAALVAAAAVACCVWGCGVSRLRLLLLALARLGRPAGQTIVLLSARTEASKGSR